MPPSRLTFGVEFEINLATLAKNIKDPFPSDSRQVRELRPPYERWDINRTRNYEDWDRKVKKTVAQKLKDAGLPALVTIDPDADIKSVDLTSPSLTWEHGHWIVTTDSTIVPPDIKDDANDWWGIEVNSPPFIFCPESLDAILLACKVLTTSFRTNTNPSCGLHIHVGAGHDGFAFPTLRTLMAFLWCFEPAIDTLHPPSRHNHNWCSSLRKASRLARQSRDISNVSAVCRILAQTDADALLDQMDDAGTLNEAAYNTANLRTEGRWFDGPPEKITFEFRQHEGTLDGPRVVAWVETVVGLLEVAEDCDRFWMSAFVLECAELEDRSREVGDGSAELYEIEHLLRDIGLGEPAEFYENRPHLS
jgi:hypothetical protein